MDAINILFNILGNGMSAKLFVEVREQLGLVYSIGLMMDAYKEGSAFIVYFSATQKNVEKSIVTIKKVLDEIKQNGITKEELAKAKNSLITQIKFGYEDNELLARNNAEDVAVYDTTFSKEYEINEINKITLQQVNETAKELFSSKSVVMGYAGKTIKTNLLDLYANTKVEKEEKEATM